MKIDKNVFNRTLVHDLLEVRKFRIFNEIKNTDCFTRLYKKMTLHIIEQPCKGIFNIGDKADSMFLVRQGMV